MYEDTLLSGEEALLREIVAALSTVCSVRPAEGDEMAELAGILGAFQLLRGGRSLVLADASHLARENLRAVYCVVVLTQALARSGRHPDPFDQGIREAYQLILIDLPRDLGRVMIRPARVGDRVSDWFGRQGAELREQPEFSRNYHMLADDDEKVRQAFRWGFMDVVSGYRGLLIEVSGKRLLVMNGKVLNREDALELSSAAFAMRRSIR